MKSFDDYICIADLDLWYDVPSFDDTIPGNRYKINKNALLRFSNANYNYKKLVKNVSPNKACNEKTPNWENEALLLGNGYMGAVVYGGVKNETLTMNEKTLWQGGPGSKKENETGEEIYGNWQKAQKGYKELRQKIINDPNHEIDPETARNMLLGNSESSLFREKHGSYQTLCDIEITMEHSGRASRYIRGLNLSTATAVVAYEINGIKYKREYFMNYPQNVFCIRLTSDKKNALSFTLSIIGRQQGGYTVFSNRDTITLRGALPGEWKHNEEGQKLLHGNGMKYEAQAFVKADGGDIRELDNSLKISNADSVVILFNAGTDYLQDYNKNYKGTAPHKKVCDIIEYAKEIGYDTLYKNHADDYLSIYDKSKLYLCGKKPSKTTDDLIRGYQDASESEKRYTENLIFNMGRYLLIASSREGSLPANLQGVWNPYISPIWESDYHININLQMNYWMADTLNMAETLIPYFNFIMDLKKAGTVTAKTIYGYSDGSWVTHNPLNTMGHTGLQFYGPGLWFPEGSAWLLRQVFEHYYFTGDKEFLNEAYPVIRDNARFWVNYLVEDPFEKETLICMPTCLPEQPPYTLAACMSMQIAEDILRNFMNISGDYENKSDSDIELVNKINDILKHLDNGLSIDEKTKTIRDWKYKPSRTGGNFRHLNQLYSFYPGDALNTIEEPHKSELIAAACNFLNQRGVDGTPGWSRAWRSALWARFNNPKKAFDSISSIIYTGIIGNNLLMRHPPFQIDANLGYCAAIAEMLIQSHEGYINLLPALPEEWAEGRFDNFVARGNYSVSASWNDNALKYVKIIAKQDGNLSVKAINIADAVISINDKITACKEINENMMTIHMNKNDILEISYL